MCFHFNCIKWESEFKREGNPVRRAKGPGPLVYEINRDKERDLYIVNLYTQSDKESYVTPAVLAEYKLLDSAIAHIEILFRRIVSDPDFTLDPNWGWD